jgi:hypothetical protein
MTLPAKNGSLEITFATNTYSGYLNVDDAGSK